MSLDMYHIGWAAIPHLGWKGCPIFRQTHILWGFTPHMVSGDHSFIIIIISSIIIYHHIPSYVIIHHHRQSHIIIYHHISSYTIVYHHMSSYISSYILTCILNLICQTFTIPTCLFHKGITRWSQLPEVGWRDNLQEITEFDCKNNVSFRVSFQWIHW